VKAANVLAGPRWPVSWTLRLTAAAVAVAAAITGCAAASSPAAQSPAVQRRVSAEAAGGPSPVRVPANAVFTIWRRLGPPNTAQRLVAAGGALFIQSGGNTVATITRVDPATGKSGPAIRLARVAGMTFGGGLLWIACRIDPASGRESVVALSPGSLKIRHVLSLTVGRMSSTSPLAYAGGQLWAVTGRGLVAIDPAAGRTVRTVPVAADRPFDFLNVAASANGAALWTTEGPGGGGPIGVQLRSPRTGAVLAAASGPAVGIGGVQIAAAGRHAWLAYATGSLGGYIRAAAAGRGVLAESRPPGRAEFSNSIQVYLAGHQLWLTDGMAAFVACASAATGRILAAAHGVGAVSDLAPLPAGRLALIIQGQVLLITPKPACGP
jgi:hypothetical protein